TASIDMNTAGYIDAKLPQVLLPTPYSRHGDTPILLLLLVLLSGLTWWGRQI
ncbi:MAG: apolipoprotein N-acyltransferase, partial [Yoonia sp.]